MKSLELKRETAEIWGINSTVQKTAQNREKTSNGDYFTCLSNVQKFTSVKKVKEKSLQGFTKFLLCSKFQKKVQKS